MSPTQTNMPEASIKAMSTLIGRLPPGDVPKAWWSSTHEHVLKAYDQYKSDIAQWQAGYKALLTMLKLPPNTPYITHSKDIFVGISPPKGAETPRWMRIDKNGVMVPRKRTVAEKESDVAMAFDRLVDIPVAINRLPGISEVIIKDTALYPVQVCQPGRAVLAFAGVSPEQATEPFEVGPEWSRMKLSTYHLLKERQEAGKW